MGKGVLLSHALPPLQLVTKIIGKTFRYTWIQLPSCHDPNQFFWLFVLFCLFALCPRYLVLRYWLKACNLKITSSVWGLNATKRACMVRGMTFVDSWTGTFDETDFCPPTYSMRHIYFMKREGAYESIVLLWSLSP
jgi:hypothetical protein